MGRLKKVLEKRLMDHPRIEKLFPEGPSLDEKSEKHFKIKTKLINSGEKYSVHECRISLVSNEELIEHINDRAIVDAMISFEEKDGIHHKKSYRHIYKVLQVDRICNCSEHEDRNQNDIVLHVVNNIER